jgi:hypothetical protein
MSLRGFSTLNFWAEDVDAVAAWYGQFLGVEPYFERSGADGKLAYAEFRIGDYQNKHSCPPHHAVGYPDIDAQTTQSPRPFVT